MATPQQSQWLRRSEVADLLDVRPGTITKWTRQGWFTEYNVRTLATLGGHHRYNAADIHRLRDQLDFRSSREVRP